MIIILIIIILIIIIIMIVINKTSISDKTPMWSNVDCDAVDLGVELCELAGLLRLEDALLDVLGDLRHCLQRLGEVRLVQVVRGRLLLEVGQQHLVARDALHRQDQQRARQLAAAQRALLGDEVEDRGALHALAQQERGGGLAVAVGGVELEVGGEALEDVAHHGRVAPRLEARAQLLLSLIHI